MKNKIILLIKLGLKIGLLTLLFIVGLSFYISTSTKSIIFKKTENVSTSYTALVLGAKVYKNGSLSGVLKDRLDAALELYNAKKIKRFLLSGDHGTTNYDEVNQMKKYLLKNNVSIHDIFLDHAGFDTYNSVYRAKLIFNVKEVIIVTQGFHVKRAVYIARNIGLNVQGYKADKHVYGIAKKMLFRESLANVKAFFELLIHRKPKFLGSVIDIKGDSSKSFD